MDYLIFNNDCLMILPRIKSKYMRAIITSPPYYKLKEYGKLSAEIDAGTIENYLSKLKTVFKQCHRILKPGGVFCLNIDRGKAEAGFHLTNPWEICSLALEIGFKLIDTIIWRYDRRPGALEKHLHHIDEPIFLLAKDNNYKRFPEHLLSEFRKDIWYINYNSIVPPEGVATFPNELVNNLILLTSEVNDWILDPFLGSGTTMLEAVKLRRNCLGIEINELYCKRAFDRIYPVLNKTDILKLA